MNPNKSKTKSNTKSKKVLMWLVLLLFLGGGLLPGCGLIQAEEALPFRDIENHWGQETLRWGIEAGVVHGFPDGTIQPDGKVTEAQFLAMLFRTFPKQEPVPSGNDWYSPYYSKAAAWNWPVAETDASVELNRGQVAQIVAASQGQQLAADKAVAFLLANELAQGRRAADGRVVFGTNEALTRAEAVQFVRNLREADLVLGAVSTPPAGNDAAESAAFTVAGLGVGDTEAEVLQTLGTPARKDRSEYGFDWYVYNRDYRAFTMIGLKNGVVTALYANGNNMSLKGVAKEVASLDVQRALGSPLKWILKGNTRYLINGDKEFDVFEVEDAYITVFYDLHEEGRVSGVQAIEKQTELLLKGFYGTPNDAIRQSFERQTLDLVNSARVKRGLSPMEWNGDVALTARDHSADMAANNYFDHDNLQGQSPFDRMKADGIRYSSAGENIAVGQASAIFAHEGWMNSEGHRINILNDFTHLGVGVAFGDENRPYYTQNFITPRSR